MQRKYTKKVCRGSILREYTERGCILFIGDVYEI